MTLKKRLFYCILLSAVPLFAQTAELRSTTKSGGTPSAPYCTPWVDNGSKDAEPWASTSNYITLLPADQLQTIITWGGTIQERHWEAMKVLSAAGQDSVMRELYDTSGCNMGFMRVSIGCSDFDLNEAPLSLNETAGDYEMTNFSIKRDSLRKIPLIKMAQKINPKLRFWGCPWSPPKWMHDNGKYDSGNMINSPQNYSAYAIYLEKFAQSYKNIGINIEMLCCQNEPNINTGGYPKCGWSSAQEIDFYKNYMIPLFKKDNIETKIFLGVFCCGDYSEWISGILKDQTIRGFTAATSHSFQNPDWGTKSVNEFPDLPFFQSEAPFVYWNTEDTPQNWDRGIDLFNNMHDFMNNNCSVYTLWNMVNDETSKSGFNWPQTIAITINSKTKQVSYNPWFWAYKHFGYYVKPGAKAIKYTVTGAGPTKVSAFRNPNGDLILVAHNSSNSPYQLNVKVGNQMWKASLPATSFNTLKINTGTTSISAGNSKEKQTVEPLLKNVYMNKSTLSFTLSAIKNIQSLSVTLNDLQGRTVWQSSRDSRMISSGLQTFSVNSQKDGLTSGTYLMTVRITDRNGAVRTVKNNVKAVN
jgi:glucosylceramidase